MDHITQSFPSITSQHYQTHFKITSFNSQSYLHLFFYLLSHSFSSSTTLLTCVNLYLSRSHSLGLLSISISLSSSLISYCSVSPCPVQPLLLCQASGRTIPFHPAKGLNFSCFLLLPLKLNIQHIKVTVKPKNTFSISCNFTAVGRLFYSIFVCTIVGQMSLSQQFN